MQKKTFVEQHGPAIFAIGGILLTVVNIVIAQVHYSSGVQKDQLNTLEADVIQYAESNFFSKTEGIELKRDLVYIKTAIDELKESQEKIIDKNDKVLQLLQQNLKKR